MALIVEDGSGLANAEALCTVAFADSYHLKLGNTAWAAASEANKEVALRKGADYLEAEYEGRWIGDRATETQRLSWPRINAEEPDGYIVASNSVPLRAQEGNAEAGLLALTEDLLAVIEPGAFATRVKVGPIEREIEPGSPVEKSYPKIEGRLHGLIDSAGGRALVLA